LYFLSFSVNEEVDAEPADDVEKKKSKNPFKGLFRLLSTPPVTLFLFNAYTNITV